MEVCDAVLGRQVVTMDREQMQQQLVHADHSTPLVQLWRHSRPDLDHPHVAQPGEEAA